jgi:hypothetical protein
MSPGFSVRWRSTVKGSPTHADAQTHVAATPIRSRLRLFDALPGCTRPGRVFAVEVTRLPAEVYGTQVEVQLIIDGQYALIALAETHGRYRIDDIVTDPTIDLAPPLVA